MTKRSDVITGLAIMRGVMDAFEERALADRKN
jgi:hypothetical protein